MKANKHTSSANGQVSAKSLVRQLTWSVVSPPLLVHSESDVWPDELWFEQQRAGLQPLLESLSVTPSNLDTFIKAERDVRLGARFERLLEFWLDAHPEIDVLARRLQCSHQGRTIGEFDFLVRSRTQAKSPNKSPKRIDAEHWEVACKFYLGVPRDNVMHWVGPGKRDRLVRKLARVQSHQLALSQQDGARELLAERGIKVGATRAVIKGRLFYPWVIDNTDEVTQQIDCEPLPAGLSLCAEHERGYWCESDSPLVTEATKIVLLPKAFWLDPVAQVGRTPIDLEPLAELCTSAPQCCDIQRTDGTVMRIFVVTPGWFADFP